MKKTNKTLMFIILISVLLSSCKKKTENSDFLSPFTDLYKKGVKTDRFDNKLFRQIVAKRKFPGRFIWKPGKRTEGKLVFTLISKLRDPGKLERGSFRFYVKKNGDTLLEIELKSKFYQSRQRGLPSIFIRKFRIPVNLDGREDIIFGIEPASKDIVESFDGLDSFEIGNPHILRRSGSGLENLMIISIDTLRADYLGYYLKKFKKKYPKANLTPNIDKLANDSVIFFNTYTTISSTWPALSSLMTSRMPFDHGVNENGQQLKDNSGTLPRLFFEKGFFNVSFRANSFPLKIGGFYEVKNFFRNDRKLIDLAKNFLNENYGQKFFFWTHFMGVHAGYRPKKKILKQIEKEEYKGKLTGNARKLSMVTAKKMKVTAADITHVRNLYSGELLQLDGWLKEIFDIMKKRDIYDRTMIILLADHGEDLYEHNYHFFHHPSIYNSSLHIPLLIKFPNSMYKKEINEVVSIIDVMPTILEYFHIKPVEKPDGISLLPLIMGETNKIPRNYVVSESESSRIFAATGRKFKYIFNPFEITPRTQFGNPYPIGKEEFYKIISDPGEKNKILSGEDLREFKKLKSFMIRYIRLKKIWEKRKNLKKGKLSPEAKKELKTLGYI